MMVTVGSALALSFAQFGDPRVLRILAKTLAISLLLFVILGWLGWTLLDSALATAGLTDGLFRGAEGLREAASLVLTLLGGWLLWRLIAMGVIGYYAGEVVEAVEQRHYPQAALQARRLGVGEDLSTSLRATLRALGINLVVLPLALVLLVTGIGTAILFWLVNALLVGRELQDAVWLRHAHAQGQQAPIGRIERFLLGAAIAGLLLVPFANFLAPMLGAAAATHLLHRNRPAADA